MRGKRNSRRKSQPKREVIGFGYGAYHFPYLLRKDAGGKYIVCLACKNKSYNKQDIDERECSYCNTLRKDTSPPWRQGKSDYIAGMYTQNLWSLS